MEDQSNLYPKVKNLMENHLIGKENYRISSAIIKEMFLFHNMIFPKNRNFGRSCGACREKVYNRLKKWYFEMKKQNEDEGNI